jgi:nucleotide-binding universal stress UspA family protein
MLKNLIVPLDGSPLAEHALPYAVRLARDHGARVILLHARWPVTPEKDVPDLEQVAGPLRSEGTDIEVRVCHMPSLEECGQAILEAAASLEADLIVMATHGRGGLGRLLYGSVADQVLRQATMPVVFVSPFCERIWPDDRPLRVLVTLDGSDLSEAALDPLHDLVGTLGAELVLLRVGESIDFIKPHGDECDVCRAARARGEEPDIEPVRLKRYVEKVATRLREVGMDVSAEGRQCGDAHRPPDVDHR